MTFNWSNLFLVVSASMTFSLCFADIGPLKNLQRIIGGDFAEEGKYNFVVTIIRNKHLLCGGSILNKNTIITAAHCLENDPLSFEVYVGHSSIELIKIKGLFKVSMAVSHPDYDDILVHNDIGLLKLDRDIDFESFGGSVGPIKLVEMPSQDESYKLSKLNCYTMGWGMTEEMKSSKKLKELSVPVLNNSICAKYSFRFSTNTQLCAGYLEGGRDSCSGDSGGPLICRPKSDDSEFRLYGLVSYGDGCALKDHPGYYTRVSSYLDWIQIYINL